MVELQRRLKKGRDGIRQRDETEGDELYGGDKGQHESQG